MIGWLPSFVLMPLILLGLGAKWAAGLAYALVTFRWLGPAASALLLATVFVMTVGFSAANVLLGLGVGLLLVIRRPALKKRPHVRTVLRGAFGIVALAAAMLVEIAKGVALNVRLLLNLRSPERADIVEVPLGERTEAGITLSGLLITAAPGMMMVGVDRASRKMLVHALDASDPVAVCRSVEKLYHRYQKRVLP